MSTSVLPARRAPDGFAILTMIALCAIWGLQQVASITGGAAFDITQPSQVARAFIEGFSRRLCDPHCAAP